MEMRTSSAVTALEPDPRRAASVRVHVAGRSCYTVPRDVAEAAGIVVGRELDDALHERLSRAADVEAAFRTALAALEQRPYARVDLGRRLVRRGHPPEAADAAIERVIGLGLLDDAAFARTYVEVRSGRGRGPSRLRRDLQVMGVGRVDVDAALAARWPDGVEDPDMPLALARKRAAQLGDLPRQMKRRRLLAYLARRGFTGRNATAAVASILER